MEQTIAVGIDVSADKLNVAWQAGSGELNEGEYPQTVRGWRKIKNQVIKAANGREAIVVLEATGTYWLGLAYFLHEHGVVVKAVNPAQAHYFMKSYLQKDKTDQVDARLLCQMAAERHTSLPTWTPPPVIYEEIYQRLLLREALVESRQHLRNHVHALSQRPHQVASVMAMYAAQIETLTEQIKTLDKELERTLKTESEWSETAKHLMSMKGVGTLTAAWLLVVTRNFTTSDTPEQLAAYIGLVPREYSSGTSVKRRSKIGRSSCPRLRSTLYMAALSACSSNPVIIRFYDRLLKNGKPKKVAIIASAHKMMKILFALAKNGVDFDPNFAPITN